MIEPSLSKIYWSFRRLTSKTYSSSGSQLKDLLEVQAANRQDLLELKAASKQDLLELRVATKQDLEQMTNRLEARIASSHSVNIKHHLETRQAIGELTRDVAALREGLVQAGQQPRAT